MIRRSLLLLLALALVPAGMARAAFHLAHIAEVNARAGGNAAEQYVEIVMEFGSQTVTTNSVLAGWDCAGNPFPNDLLLVPGNIPTGGAGLRWIMATTDPVGGITPDFVIPSPGIPTDCGQVCWGAPDDTFFPPNDPNSWDHTNPNNFIDCVAYGPYTGPTRAGSGAPSALTPGDGTYSLVRVDDTTVAAACPSPQNNAGAVGGYGACTDPTTTTTTTVTTTSTSVTTTTAPPTVPELLPGKKLDLRVKAGKPEKSKLFIASQKDEALTLGRGPGSPDDPRQYGGTLLVTSSSPGGAFTDVYPLDSSAGGWSASEKKGEITGFVFKSGGPITSVRIKAGKTLVVKGTGADLALDLGDDPNPVAVVLTIGEHRYCLGFGGKAKFTADKRYKATKAPAPSACTELPD
jgi:hypothetical protein